MEQSEKIFWSITAVAGFYIVASTFFGIGPKVNAQVSQPVQQVLANQAAPTQGMGCMSKGGGCGCGGMKGMKMN